MWELFRRNQRCRCGSGKTYKRCCGRISPNPSIRGSTELEIGRTRQLEVNVRETSYPFEIFNNEFSLGVTQRVMSGSSYPVVEFISNIRTIVDIGANIGAASVYFALQYPHAEVYAFEPSPEAYDLLLTNTKKIGRIHPTNCGLLDRDGTSFLYRGNDDSITASIGHSVQSSALGDVVNVRDARRALEEVAIKTIDILKIDTEGCEVPILRSLGDLALSARLIYFEFHSEADRATIDTMLRGTHSLYCGKVNSPHRGEYCYVHRSSFPSESDYRNFAITLNHRDIGTLADGPTAHLDADETML